MIYKICTHEYIDKNTRMIVSSSLIRLDENEVHLLDPFFINVWESTL